MWYMPTIDCYSSLKRKETLIPAATWMSVEDIIVNEISQSVTKREMLI